MPPWTLTIYQETISTIQLKLPFVDSAPTFSRGFWNNLLHACQRVSGKLSCGWANDGLLIIGFKTPPPLHGWNGQRWQRVTIQAERREGGEEDAGEQLSHLGWLSTGRNFKPFCQEGKASEGASSILDSYPSRKHWGTFHLFIHSSYLLVYLLHRDNTHLYCMISSTASIQLLALINCL